MSFLITAFYNFSPLSEMDVRFLSEEITELGERLDLCGLLIISKEGLNATLAGPPEGVEELEEYIRSVPGFSETIFKHSHAKFKPFRRFKVKEREQIVTAASPYLKPDGKNGHLSPEEWDEMMKRRDSVVIDTRNWYETKVGIFKDAIDPKIQVFSEFKDYMKESKISKKKKVMLYCTGGIRCEKAVLEMHELGYNNVYQLDGGILRYLEENPEGKFDGECFVFDHRVAVDKDLNPSEKYHLCIHCGNPGDLSITCSYCKGDGIICTECAEGEPGNSCSKNCAHHLARGSRRRNNAAPTELPKRKVRIAA